MKRVPLYSSSQRPRTVARPSPVGAAQPGTAAPQVVSNTRIARCRQFCGRHERSLTLIASAFIAVLVVAGHAALFPAPRQLVQKDIDAAVLHTVENNVLPSEAARAYEAIRGSVVHVRGTTPLADLEKGKSRNPHKRKGKDSDKEEETVQGVGTGVVIIDKGTVVSG